MSTVPALFEQPLAEAWDSLWAIPLSPCDTTIDSRALESIKSYHPQPVLYTRSKKPEKGYNDKTYEKNLHYGLLVGRALSTINLYVYKLNKNLTDDVLEQVLMEYYPLALEELDLNSDMTTPYEAHMDGEKPSSLTNWGYAEQQCRNAVQSARMFWDPTVYPEIQRRAREQGAKGGRAYSTYTLEDHLATAHLTAAEASQALGLNIRTVYRMKKRYADIDLATGGVHGEQETSEEAPSTQPVESDRLGARTGNDSRPPADGLAEPDADGSAAPSPHAALATAVDGETGRILLDLHYVKLPY